MRWPLEYGWRFISAKVSGPRLTMRVSSSGRSDSSISTNTDRPLDDADPTEVRYF
jgi:hypothetical protein